MKNGFEVDFRLSDELSLRISRLSERLARLWRIETFCRMDFIVDYAGKIYFLENNIVPGLTEGSIFPQMLKRVGMSLVDLISVCSENQIGKRRSGEARVVQSRS